MVKEENNQREAAWLLRDRETRTLTLGAVCVMMWKMPCSENSGELDFRERLFVFFATGLWGDDGKATSGGLEFSEVMGRLRE